MNAANDIAVAMMIKDVMKREGAGRARDSDGNFRKFFSRRRDVRASGAGPSAGRVESSAVQKQRQLPVLCGCQRGWQEAEAIGGSTTTVPGVA